MSGPDNCFLSVPSGPEAVLCLVRFRRSFISRTVITWNSSPKSRALWLEPSTVKGIVILGEVPHSDVKKDYILRFESTCILLF